MVECFLCIRFDSGINYLVSVVVCFDPLGDTHHVRRGRICEHRDVRVRVVAQNRLDHFLWRRNVLSHMEERKVFRLSRPHVVTNL